MVEQRTENPRVTGSIPVLGTLCASGSVVEHRLAKARVASSNLVSRFLCHLAQKQFHRKHGYFMREWLSGRASPCQGEGREFESRLALSYVSCFLKKLYIICASGSVVEHRLAKARVASSNLVSRCFREYLLDALFFYLKHS